MLTITKYLLKVSMCKSTNIDRPTLDLEVSLEALPEWKVALTSF